MKKNMHRFKEKELMLGGYIVLFLAVIVLLPWGNDFPSVQIPSITKLNFFY